MSRPVGTVEPHTSNLYVEPIRYDVIEKIDLLFMIDNSRSMGDKQKLLATAVPQLVDRLVVPRCVGGGMVHERTTVDEACPAGTAPEFHAVKDIHIAVISSSLGAHGASNSSCSGASPEHDRALLLPSVRPNLSLASYEGRGFLAWDPEKSLTPPGETDRSKLGSDFANMVQAAGEVGCGFEASLESWYRFLIDPEPPVDVTVGEDGRSVAGAVDTELLAQRAAFLRPDSLVAIVMLTDENDCSIRDDEFGNFLANSKARMPRGTSACERDPNDPCCLPCTLTGAAPAGCGPVASDEACQRDTHLSEPEDPPNLRCLENKRRFGYDFLHPVSRYVRGLTEYEVPLRSTGGTAPNPLFAAPPGQPRRGRDLVYLAGIVGVPWQDIADDASRAGAGLRYLTAQELSAKGRWATIVGDPSSNQLPADPFMRESTAPRSGVNPITSDPIVKATSTNPRENAINGHEQIDIDGTDLQYACTFSLVEPEECDSDSCDCDGDTNPAVKDDLDRNRPLCQPPGGGAATTTQYFGKAYPGLRPLQVLQGLGESAIVASICPKVLTEGEPGYGYEPAVDAIVERLKVALGGRCPPRPLAVEPEAGGRLPCVVVEALPREEGIACGCSAERRSVASPEEQKMVQARLKESGQCGGQDGPSCDSFCFCSLEQAEGDNLKSCLNDEVGSNTPGYCYLDPFGTPPVGNPALVEDCGDSPRKIRFVGPDTPTPGATAFIACLGATLH